MAKIAEQWLHKILETMYERRTVTRAQILQSTRLNPASVSHTLQHLLKRGTILKVGELQSKAGRRRDVLTLNSEAGFFVAVDLEGTRIRFALTNFVGDIRYRWEEDIQFGKVLELDPIVEGIQMVLRNLTEAQLSQLLAIGVSCPGIIDKTGRVTAFNLGWQKVQLVEELQKTFKFPIYLEHATRSAILAEHWVGLAQNTRNFLYVMVGNGVGVGIFSNGKFVGGRDQMAGEIGHIRMDPDGNDLCRCGKTGCLEAIVSSPNLVRQYLEKSGLNRSDSSGFKVTEVFDRARQSDPVAEAVLERAANYLGLAISYLVNFLNPELIILGGDLVNGEDILLPKIQAQIQENALSDFVDNLRTAVSRLGLDIGLKGAASLAFRNSLSNPEVLKKMCRPVVELHQSGVVEARPDLVP